MILATFSFNKVKGKRYCYWLAVILGLDRTAGLTFGTKTALKGCRRWI